MHGVPLISLTHPCLDWQDDIALEPVLTSFGEAEGAELKLRAGLICLG